MAGFPSTHWSEVARAGDSDPHLRRAALGRLMSSYLPAFRAHLTFRHRIPADQVEDLLQGFVCDQVVARDLIAAADQRRGRLRTFLLTALERYVAKAARRDRAAKRGGDGAPVSIDQLPAEPSDPGCAAADVFDLEWARQAVTRAVQIMREECEANRRQQIWAVFDGRVLAPLLHDATIIEYPDLAARCGFDSPRQAANALTTAKRMFIRALRSVVGEYAADEAETDAELKDLWAILQWGGKH